MDNPDLRCVSVLANGNVQLNWIATTNDSTNFNEYEVWRDGSLIDSISTFAATSYTDGGVNANLASHSYYLISQSGCTGQENANSPVPTTLASIYLTTTNTSANTDPGIATLNWSALPLIPTSGNYITNSNYNSATLVPFGAGTTLLTDTQHIIDCNVNLQHQITVVDNSGCVSKSNIAANTFTYLGHVVSNPDLRCVSVLANGNVQLNWITPTNGNIDFNEFEVWRDNVLIDSINTFTNTSYTDVNVNANTASHAYFLISQSGCTGQVLSNTPFNTLNSIKVDVLNNNGIALITWNKIHVPDLSTASGIYDVYKEYPPGTWIQLGTTPLLNYSDTINICSSVINYRVTTSDASGCIDSSSIDGKLFHDVTKPVPPIMESVSVNPNNSGNITITWLPSAAHDAIGYYVYLNNNTGGSYTNIGTVTSGFSFVTTGNVTNTIYNYAVAAYDSCGNVGAIGIDLNTINLKAKLDVCRAAIDLKWNPYLVNGGVSSFKIHVSENGAPYNLLATVGNTSVSYSHTTLTANSYYRYYVEAVTNTMARTATSNSDSVFAELLTLPTFSYLKTATVKDSRKVYVEALVDNTPGVDVSKYKLQRSPTVGGPFNTVGVVNFNNMPIISFTDYTAQTENGSYYYRIITVDSCGNNVLISNLGRTIFINGHPDFNLINKLAWNNYDGWMGGLKDFSLYRAVDGIWDPTPVTKPTFGINDYNDNVADIYQTTGKFCYKIQAYEGPGNTYGFADSSMSNEFCLIQEPHLYVPSAFTPGGKNPVFKPSFIYIDPKNYQFLVFSRWGEKVFETNDPSIGWDGTINGSVASENPSAPTVLSRSISSVA